MKCFLSILTLILIYSCRKDNYGTELDGEKVFLIGEWELESSIYFDFCGGTGHHYLTAEEQGIGYRIVFEKRGYVSFYQNDSLVEGGYVCFSAGGFETQYTGSVVDSKVIYFSIWLDNDKTRRFSGSGSLDSIRTNYTPRIGVEPYGPGVCEAYRDYFRRK